MKVLTHSDIAACFPHIPGVHINTAFLEYMPVTADFVALDLRLGFLQESTAHTPRFLRPFIATQVAHQMHIERHPGQPSPAVGVELLRGGVGFLVAILAGQEDSPVYYDANIERCDAPRGKGLCVIM